MVKQQIPQIAVIVTAGIIVILILFLAFNFYLNLQAQQVQQQQTQQQQMIVYCNSIGQIYNPTTAQCQPRPITDTIIDILANLTRQITQPLSQIVQTGQNIIQPIVDVLSNVVGTINPLEQCSIWQQAYRESLLFLFGGTRVTC